MTSARPKVGEMFRALDRAGSLTGLLGDPSFPAAGSPPAPSPLTPDELSETSATPQEITDGPARGRRSSRQSQTVRPGATPDGPHAGSATRVVPVVVDVSIVSDLRAFAVRTEQTYGDVTLRAIEANADELSKHWLAERARQKVSGQLFGRSTRIRRRTEPGVQTQLRIAAADAATLDRLVGSWSAPSRSALVNEALRRYVRLSDKNGAAAGVARS